MNISENSPPTSSSGKRQAGRHLDRLRPLSFERRYTRYAEGSVLVVWGETRVLCTASVEEKAPIFLKGTDRGWITAEYAMLPRATDRRTPRPSSGKISGRSAEIQRLIGRSLRAGVDLSQLGPRTITVDCDVLQADGGTRTAAINGGFVALADALRLLVQNGVLRQLPLISVISAVSAGKLKTENLENEIYLDLDSGEDRAAEVDFNVVMNHRGDFVEMQGTGEDGFFSRREMNRILDLCEQGCNEIRRIQLEVLDFSTEEKSSLAF